MYDAKTLLSAMEASKTPIYTYCHGYVMSAGLTIFTAGHRRFAGNYATFMIHQPTGNAGEDKLFVMENRIEETKRLKNIRTKYICDRTKLTEEDFENNRYIDWFMNTNEAKAYGIVHEVIGEGFGNAL
ncbi:ATP-dependent Clp protease proteolytic subunit [compost metagenome]